MLRAADALRVEGRRIDDDFLSAEKVAAETVRVAGPTSNNRDKDRKDRE